MTHWTFDTAMLARSVGSALSEQGGRTWYFIRADYVFGKVWSFAWDGTNNIQTVKDHSIELATKSLNITSFGQDASGRVYVVSGGGSVFRIDAQLCRARARRTGLSS